MEFAVFFLDLNLISRSNQYGSVTNPFQKYLKHLNILLQNIDFAFRLTTFRSASLQERNMVNNTKYLECWNIYLQNAKTSIWYA